MEYIQGIHQNTHYTPLLVDTDFYKSMLTTNLTNERFMVGWAGNESNRLKNLELRDAVIDALPKDVIFKKAGKAQSQHHPIYPKGTMPLYYSTLDCLILTSRNEGGPLVAFEAMSCGTPVISTRVGNMPELIQNGVNGFLVKPIVEDFTEKILYLKNNPTVLAQMKIDARKTILEDWTWSVWLDGWKKFLGVK